MQWSGVDIPEAYWRALQVGSQEDLVDAAVRTPEERFARGLLRASIGKEADAREDLEASVTAFGEAAQIELALLDMRQRSGLEEARQTARAIARRADSEATLRARALHVLGLAEAKRRHTPEALDALLEAARLYGETENRSGRAQVHDSAGMVLAARGRLDQAVYWYALSLADKALLGDRMGMAITLGNLGRLHLRTGRTADALECFRRDLELAETLGDRRGQARMHEDIGRALAAAENHEAAAESYARAIHMAEEGGYEDLLFFAWRDVCLLHLDTGDLDGAEAALSHARTHLPTGGEPYFHLLLGAAEAQWMLATGADGGVKRMQETVEGLRQADLPDWEIPARILLAQALHARGEDARAEHCLMRALARARRDGYARYLTPLNEALSAIGMVADVLAEESRPTAGEDGGAGDAYILRRLLGSGAFGEVYRAYDPERHREVAFKRIFLDRVYDPGQRKHLMDSARLELQAASRVRHPGIVRVLAVGNERGGGMYVVQEFVEGRPLSVRMEAEANPAPESVLRILADIAYALQALHDAGVVHRDLKPDNILIRPDDTPVLVDFGIAHVVSNEGAEDEGLLVGTLRYMAPEQMQGRIVDHRADLYALGAIAFEWLTGRLPIVPEGETLLDQFRHMLSTTPARLLEVRPGLSPSLGTLINGLLAEDPLRRPAPASEVAQAFLHAADGG
jgi:tetratricopeptide (TPR) repeat protein